MSQFTIGNKKLPTCIFCTGANTINIIIPGGGKNFGLFDD